MVAFRHAGDGERLPGKISALLQNRHAMHFGEICLRLGVEEKTLRSALDRMMLLGEIERLTPIDFPGQPRVDWDFFRIPGPPPVIEHGNRWWKWWENIGKKTFTRQTGGRMVCSSV